MSNNDKYCLIDFKNKTSNCDDKYYKIESTCKVVKNNVRTYYEPTPSATPADGILKVTRDPNIDYNFFRAGR
jgi:hypothetical protein